MKKAFIFIFAVIFIFTAAVFLKNRLSGRFFSQAAKPAEIKANLTANDIEIVAGKLKIPWEIAFLPDQSILLTERPGALVRIGLGETFARIKVNGVKSIGEGGLLGMAIHPDFEKNHWLYLYFTAETAGGLKNQVIRYVFLDNQFKDEKIIIGDIPAGANHDGGRLAFGPDGFLYVTTGDAGNGNSAQDTKSLAGKILRLTDDGGWPEDNPFFNPVYSYGHRNPQGLAWDSRGRLWSTEHGRSGVLSGFDELNLIKKGGNYGWPLIQGDQARSGMEKPLINSGAKKTWAPSGALYFSGKILFAGLRGQSLYAASITPNGEISEFKGYFKNEFGRLRSLALSPDGYFYLLTSNTDGRGRPESGDDRVIKFKTDFLNTTPPN